MQSRAGARETLERIFRDQASRQTRCQNGTRLRSIAGLGLGSLIGVMVSGPTSTTGPPSCPSWEYSVRAVGAAIGYLAVSIAYGSTAAGFGMRAGSLILDTGQVALRSGDGGGGEAVL